MPVLPVTELVSWWRSLPASAGGTRVLALDGRSGAGKTSVAGLLAAAAPDVVVVPLEGIYPGWDGLAAIAALVVEQLLRPLSLGEPAGYWGWDWARDTAGAWRPIEAAPPLLLLEGIGSGARICAPYVSGLVWLEAPPDLRRERALARDGQDYAGNWQRWADQEATYLAREQPPQRADLVLNGAATPCGTGAALQVLVDRRPSGRSRAAAR